MNILLVFISFGFVFGHYLLNDGLFLVDKFCFYLAFFYFQFLEILTVAAVPTPQDISTSILQNKRYPDAQVQLIPSIYNPHTIVTYSNNNGNNAQTHLIDYLTSTNATIDEISNNTIISYVVSQWNQSEDNFINKYQLGFALFNNLTSFHLH